MRPLAASLALAVASTALAEQGEQVRHLEDNSFLIEEAYNQEAGVLQNIGTFMRDRDSGSWVATFTQEWPVLSEEHQLSFTLPFSRLEGPRGERVRGVGDLALNYRYQALSDDAGAAAAVAPRVTLLVPTGSSDDGLGTGGLGGQLNLPVSVKLGRYFVTHVNLGGSWTPDGKTPDGSHASTVSYFVGQSFVALLHHRLNLLVEVLWTGTETVSRGHTSRSESFVVSPGLRVGIDLPGGLQIVPGIGLPIGVGPSANTLAVFGYLSVEFPFTRAAAPGGKS